jgi:hypothetical protein
MDAERDARAHQFIARTLSETVGWPPSLQVALHELAFVALPLAVLALEPEAAIAWARRWKVRIEEESAVLTGEDAEWVTALAQQWRASHDDAPPAQPTTSGELSRLSDLVSRLGPLAFRLPWRSEPPAKA